MSGRQMQFHLSSAFHKTHYKACTGHSGRTQPLGLLSGALPQFKSFSYRRPPQTVPGPVVFPSSTVTLASELPMGMEVPSRRPSDSGDLTISYRHDWE